MNPMPPPLPAAPKNSRLALWSVILGSLGLLLLLACVGPLLAIPAVICGHLAFARIKQSGGALGGSGLALAGLITGYVTIGLSIFIMPLLLAIAIPNFVRARQVAQKNRCVQNLRQIDAAKQQWGLENNRTNGDVSAEELNQYIKGGFQSLHCPAGGVYSINVIGAPPACSIHEHTLGDGIPDTRLSWAISNFNQQASQAAPDTNQLLEARRRQTAFEQNVQRSICRANLMQIQAMKQVWASRNRKPATAIPTTNELLSTFGSSRPPPFPACPAGGVYQIGSIAQSPSCSLPEHQFMPDGSKPAPTTSPPAPRR